FFLSSRRRHTRSKRDWSSDVCSSDLILSAYPKTSSSAKRNIVRSEALSEPKSDSHFAMSGAVKASRGIAPPLVSPSTSSESGSENSAVHGRSGGSSLILIQAYSEGAHVAGGESLRYCAPVLIRRPAARAG